VQPVHTYWCEYVRTHHGTCFLTSGFGCELPLMQSTQVLKSDKSRW